ncbi:hypothetical protein BGZ83_007048 [Gryganskiella cystojenkinii]|nr:hypothetical protein BGZ83_007048 [Gryganskiella cystojenkinii]
MSPSMTQEQQPMSTYKHPPQSTDGRLGYLTSRQIEKLQQFWIKLYDIFDSKTPFDQSAPSSYKGQPLDDEEADRMSPDSSFIDSVHGHSGSGKYSGAIPISEPPSPKSQKSSSGWLSNNSNSGSSYSSGSNGRKSINSKRNSTMTARFTGAQLHRTFWKFTMMEHPDMIILKFLRARKWIVDDAIKMLVQTLKWRIIEKVDELIELSDVELDAKYPRFLEQMKMGKGYLRGADPSDRPICVINTRVHHKSDQSAKTIRRFTLYTMECGRTVLPLGSETVIVIFDLSKFGLDNMDWSFVRLFVQCFENYYPETLEVCVVHKAPFVFRGLWKLIQPLLDPSVASKFIFTKNNAELHKVIPREVLPIQPYDGLDDWKYQYAPMQPGENDRMMDKDKKEDLLMERESLEIKFDIVTRSWIKNVRQVGQTSVDRDVIAMELREQYFRLSPYVRAKNLYQRWGVSSAGEVNWTYNLRSPTSPPSKLRTSATKTFTMTATNQARVASPIHIK